MLFFIEIDDFNPKKRKLHKICAYFAKNSNTMKALKLIATSVLITFFMSCTLDEDVDCLANTIDIASLEAEYGCVNTRYGIEIDLQNTHVIIRSQNQFENLVTGNCLPSIDFSIYNLVIGKKNLTSGNVTINYEYSYDCNLDEYLLIVEFKQNDTSVAPNLTFHALIPKLEEEESVEVRFVID